MPTIRENQRMNALAGALRLTIHTYTSHQPMTAEEVVMVLCFMAGSAAGQKEAHGETFKSRVLPKARRMRDRAVTYLDSGLEEALKGDAGSLILPH